MHNSKTGTHTKSMGEKQVGNPGNFEISPKVPKIKEYYSSNLCVVKDVENTLDAWIESKRVFPDLCVNEEYKNYVIPVFQSL